MATKISWTNETWNPCIGCSDASTDCKFCYAKREAHRLAGNPNPKIQLAYEGLTKRVGDVTKWTGVVRLLEDRLTQPLSWRRPRLIFVNSMSDLFHEALPFSDIDKVFAIMLACQVYDGIDHTFQVLTKRASRAREYLSADPLELVQRWAYAADYLTTPKDEDSIFSELVYGLCSGKWDAHGIGIGEQSPWSHPENVFPLRNLWLGTSCGNQELAEARVSDLVETPAAVRFVSCEPLLGPIDLRDINGALATWWQNGNIDCVGAGKLDWVIAGAESGPGVRPMHEAWVRDLRDQCTDADVAFFYKQKIGDDGRKVELPELDGRSWKEFPASMEVA